MFDLSSTLRRVVVVALIMSISAPVYFAFPQKTEADTVTCMGAIASAMGLSTANKAIAALTAVPVNDIGNTAAHTLTSGSTNGNFIQTCIVKPLVEMMAKSLIRQFTKSMVNWINSGFEGSPSFVQDPGKFFMNVGDRALGAFIEGLGPIGELICSPFDLRLRISLALRFSSTYKDDIGCRLSDIGRNFDNFVSGSFTGQGKGWNQWIQITDAPQNNPYGSYIAAANGIDLRIAGRHNIELMQLNWGQGFMSWSDCLQYEKKPDGTKGACLKRGPIKTPGSVIASQLNRTLESEIVQTELANSIDAILGALVNQMINQVFSSTGLFGASQPDYSGTSYADRMVTDYNKMLNSQNNLSLPKELSDPTRLPMLPDSFKNFKNNDKKNDPLGTLKALSGFCTAFNMRTYRTDFSNAAQPYGVKQVLARVTENGVTRDMFIDAPEFADMVVNQTDSNGNVVNDANGNPIKVLVKGVDIYDRTKVACQNQPYSDAIAQATNQATTDLGNALASQNQNQNQPATEEPKEANIAFNKITASSAAAGNTLMSYPSSNAVDGSLWSEFKSNEAVGWVQIDLTHDTNNPLTRHIIDSVTGIAIFNNDVSKVNITGTTLSVWNSIDDFKKGAAPVLVKTLSNFKDNPVITPISVNSPASQATYFEIRETGTPPFQIAEIKIFGKEHLEGETTGGGNTGNTGPTPASISFTGSVADVNFQSLPPYIRTGFSVYPSPKDDFKGGKLVLSLSKKNADGTYSKNSFNSLWSSLKVISFNDPNFQPVDIALRQNAVDVTVKDNFTLLAGGKYEAFILDGNFIPEYLLGISYRITASYLDSQGKEVASKTYDFQTPLEK